MRVNHRGHLRLLAVNLRVHPPFRRGLPLPPSTSPSRVIRTSSSAVIVSYGTEPGVMYISPALDQNSFSFRLSRRTALAVAPL